MGSTALLLVETTLLAIYAAGLFALGLTYRRARGIRWFVLSLLVGALAALLMGVGHATDRPFRFLGGVSLLPVSFFLRHIGLCDFLRARRRSVLWSGSLAGLFFLFACWTIFFRPDLALCVEAQAVVLLLQTVLSTEILLRFGSQTSRIVRNCTIIVLIAGVLLRLAWTAGHLFMSLQIARTIVTSHALWIFNLLGAAATTFCYVAIFVAQMEHDLHEIASTDALTGALNRRALEAQAAREMTRCRRFGFPLSVIVFDLDHFKALNDTHGHEAGDTALRTVVRDLQSTLRGTDLLCRSGGEEFLILLPHTEHATAVHIAERLRKRITQITVLLDQKQIHVTASFGVASWSGLSESWMSMVKRADAALYQAKHAGRNCVVTSDPLPPGDVVTQMA